MMSARTKNSKARLGVEKLENRELMAGNVFATVSNNTLYITGDSMANSVQVASDYHTGEVFVIGADNTLINGRAQTSIGNFRGNIEVKLGGGNDSFQLARVTDRDFRKADINMGSGDFESVNLASARFSGNVTINSLGSQKNHLEVKHGSVAGDLKIETGSGHDWVVLSSTVGGNVTLNTNGGRDQVNIGPGVGGDDNQRLRIGGRLTLNTGDGKDQVNLDRLRVDTLFANLGAGEDSFKANAVSVKRTVSVDGGTGFDRFDIQRSTANVLRGLRSFEGPII